MNYANRLWNLALWGLVALSAVSAYSSYKEREELKRLKNGQKKIDKRLSEIKNVLDIQAPRGQFTKAFRLDMNESFNGHIEDESSKDEDLSSLYTVREHNGIIGVFNDEDELLRSIDTVVAELDAPERQNLLIGIRAESEAELEKIVESFR